MTTSLPDFEYTLTREALRQIKAEAWDEGFLAGWDNHPETTNPYRD